MGNQSTVFTGRRFQNLAHAWSDDACDVDGSSGLLHLAAQVTLDVPAPVARVGAEKRSDNEAEKRQTESGRAAARRQSSTYSKSPDQNSRVSVAS